MYIFTSNKFIFLNNSSASLSTSFTKVVLSEMSLSYLLGQFQMSGPRPSPLVVSADRRYRFSCPDPEPDNFLSP